MEKNCFSGYGCAEFVTALRLLQKKQVILAGIETHVCVYQTAIDLISNGYQVSVVADAVGSRAASNKDIALQRMVAEGAKLTSTEMALFELLGRAGTPEFKEVQALVK